MATKLSAMMLWKRIPIPPAPFGSIYKRGQSSLSIKAEEMNGGYMQSIKHRIKPSWWQFPLVLTLCVQISGWLFSGHLFAQGTWQSTLVSMDTLTGELSYTAEAVSGVRIAVFSRAGYQGGGIPIPFVPVKLTISPISGDNTAHIQSAINSVSALHLDEQGFRGTLLLNPGVYEVYGRLKLGGVELMWQNAMLL